jgi:Domain of unknown function (DUF4037)
MMLSVPPVFVAGVELSVRLYHGAVRPLLSRYFPELPHTAALIGRGSEVLGFDTERSTDHDWGPRLHLFLAAADAAGYANEIADMLAARLPDTIDGYPTNFVVMGDEGTRRMQHAIGRVQHGVAIAELGDWLTGHLGFNPLLGITTLDWLATSTQALAEVTAGAVYHDGLVVGLRDVRRALRWYPDDVWRYVLACQWQRISQEEPIVSRCGEVGDELGSALVAARQVRDLMRLCLLINRTYPPYSKWLGSAFARLTCASQLGPALVGAVTADNWRDRERYLVTAYESAARLHNNLGLTAWVDPHVRPFHDRPFRVLHSERFRAALVKSITNHAVRELPLTGAIDQVVDSVEALGDWTLSRALVNAVHHAPTPG